MVDERPRQRRGVELDQRAPPTAPANHPLGALPADDDAALAIGWLASDEARFVTGATLTVDAGFSAR